MANLVVSSVCNLHCSYCFAKDYLSEKAAGYRQSFLSLQDYEIRLDFLDRSEIDEARLIGGEPTLHPQFPELIARARKHGKKIVVFTHGLIEGPALESMQTLSKDIITVLVNANTTEIPGNSNEKTHTRRTSILKRLGERATLGFTIDSANFDASYLLPMMIETGCKKSIRLGLAQPAFSGHNHHLHPRQYPFIGKKIAAFAEQAMHYGIRIEFDCGFVPCMFSQSDLELLAQSQASAEWRCNPVLDIDLNGEVSHCFPLAGRFGQFLDSSIRAVDLRGSLGNQVRPFGLAGVYQDCLSCPAHQKGDCGGGCRSVAIRQFHNANFSLSVPSTTYL